MNNARLKYLIFIYIDLRMNLGIRNNDNDMKIPKQIKIKNSIIKISTVSTAEADKGNYIGIYNTSDNTIKIKENIKDKKLLLDVVLHEIFHAILDKGNKKIRSEEPTVNFISTQLTRVLYRNKDLVNFIKRCLK